MLLHYTYLLQCAALVYANNALNVNTNTQNDKHVDEAITQLGSDWYYAICAIMGATAIGILCTSYLKPRSDRIFFYMCAAICTTACIAYYAMGSNLGWTPIDNEWRRQISGVDGRNREIFYVRYIDWYVDSRLTNYDIFVNGLFPQVRHYTAVVAGLAAHGWLAMAFNHMDHLSRYCHGRDWSRWSADEDSIQVGLVDLRSTISRETDTDRVGKAFMLQVALP